MSEFSPDEAEFDRVLSSPKEGPREAGRLLASMYVREMPLEEFKELSNSTQIPPEVQEWLSKRGIGKSSLKQVRNGFKSRIKELLDSLERSSSWEGFTGMSEEERWDQIRSG